jgi:hypothetical protein
VQTPELLADFVKFSGARIGRNVGTRSCGGRQLLARQEFPLERHFVSRIFLQKFDRKQPKLPGFTPVFRLSCRTANAKIFSALWCAALNTTTCCAFVLSNAVLRFGTFSTDGVSFSSNS